VARPSRGGTGSGGAAGAGGLRLLLHAPPPPGAWLRAWTGAAGRPARAGYTTARSGAARGGFAPLRPACGHASPRSGRGPPAPARRYTRSSRGSALYTGPRGDGSRSRGCPRADPRGAGWVCARHTRPPRARRQRGRPPHRSAALGRPRPRRVTPSVRCAQPVAGRCTAGRRGGRPRPAHPGWVRPQPGRPPPVPSGGAVEHPPRGAPRICRHRGGAATRPAPARCPHSVAPGAGAPGSGSSPRRDWTRSRSAPGERSASTSGGGGVGRPRPPVIVCSSACRAPAGVRPARPTAAADRTVQVRHRLPRSRGPHRRQAGAGPSLVRAAARDPPLRAPPAAAWRRRAGRRLCLPRLPPAGRPPHLIAPPPPGRRPYLVPPRSAGGGLAQLSPAAGARGAHARRRAFRPRRRTPGACVPYAGPVRAARPAPGARPPCATPARGRRRASLVPAEAGGDAGRSSRPCLPAKDTRAAQSRAHAVGAQSRALRTRRSRAACHPRAASASRPDCAARGHGFPQRSPPHAARIAPGSGPRPRLPPCCRQARPGPGPAKGQAVPCGPNELPHGTRWMTDPSGVGRMTWFLLDASPVRPWKRPSAPPRGGEACGAP
jgi:hypothetical protein